ncbi:MAG: HAMP domain-containing histidine kinase, partial [Coleofasciculus sp. C3-bin4]|nr:HAMP domain-containing histidine kinase [Coleofasciculus sp. C3-bin4]
YPNPAKEIEEYAETIDLEFIRTDFPKILESMEIGASRIGNIVLSLRNFSRLDEAEMKLVDLHEGLDSTLVMLQHRVQESGVEVIKEFGNLPKVECYPRQLNQVFLNIFNNAIDALEQKDMGEQGSFESRGIGTQNHPLEPSLRESPFAQQTLADSRSLRYGASAATDSEGLKLKARHLPMSLQPQDSPCITIHTELVKAQCQQTTDNGQQAIDKVVIRIADNGPGMTESVRQRLFDPFFTTKQVGKGTGLGLSISYQIVVQRHGGQLDCISEPGQGTEFFIEIPVLQPPESSR